MDAYLKLLPHITANIAPKVWFRDPRSGILGDFIDIFTFVKTYFAAFEKTCALQSEKVLHLRSD